MRKVLPALMIISLLAVFLLPMLASAQERVPESCVLRRNPKVEGCPESGDCVFETNKLCGMCCTMSTIYYVSDWIFAILLVLAIIFVLWGAFDILLAAGDTEKIKAGRNRIMSAVLAIAVALLAKAIPALVRYFIAP